MVLRLLLPIILQYLDDDILHASNTQRLTRPEVKYVAKRVLEPLAVLHDHGFLHTNICMYVPMYLFSAKFRLIRAGL